MVRQEFLLLGCINTASFALISLTINIVLKAVLRLIRWSNLSIILSAFLLFYFGIGKIIAPTQSTDLSFFLILLAGFSLCLSAAWGYAINDIRDVEADRINHPLRPLPAGQLTVFQGNVIARICLMLAIVSALIFAFISQLWWFPFILATILLLEWIYTTYLRKIPLTGIITSSVLVTSTILIPFGIHYSGNTLSFANQLSFGNYVFAYALFIFLSNLAREQSKDMEDISGDAAVGYISLPIVLGYDGARKLLAANLILLLICLFAIGAAVWDGSNFLLAAFGLSALVMPLIYCIYLSFNKKSSQKEMLRLSIILKLVMVFGLLTTLMI